jgi:phage baseplate assembly protein W
MTDTNLAGMARDTGKAMTGIDHIAQSIGDILSTPLGTRVMRRDYGSLLFELTDAPLNRATALLLIAAIAMAITRWEPRYTVRHVALAGDFASGQATVTLTGTLAGAPAANALTTLTIPIAA